MVYNTKIVPNPDGKNSKKPQAVKPAAKKKSKK
jgi:hypothetical protein